MSGTTLTYLILFSRAITALAWQALTRPNAGGLGDTGLPDPPGN